MPRNDWSKVKRIFHDSLKVDASERSGFLDKACRGDLALRLEVESLLISLNEAESFLESPLILGDGDERERQQASWRLRTGQAISHYRVEEPIDAGGMGEVYVATDLRLRRRVALKVLRSDVANDRERLKLFRREAEAVSSLNHPNILTVFDFDEVDDVHFFATELVEGETLRDRLDRNGALSLSEAVDVAIQTATALKAAHEAGVVHRDVKPENLMIRIDGYVKVLDFGLAKVTEPSGSANAEASTRALISTPGMIMGTAAYMSPEQARGLLIDGRTDIFSLGVVLYEMLTGLSPFKAETATDTIAAIVQREPRPPGESSDIPGELDRIVLKMLEKDRTNRYQTSADLLTDLKGLNVKVEASPNHAAGKSAPTAPGQVSSDATLRSPTERVSRTKRGPIFPALLVGLVVVLIAAVTAYWYLTSAQSSGVESVAVMPFINESGNPDVDYLSDGIAETLINSLSRVPNLSVKGRSSVFRYKGKDVDEKAVARELGVTAVLNGRVVQRGDEIRLSLWLDDAATGNQIWGESYNRKLSELIGLQSEIARDVAQELKVRLTGPDNQKLATNYTENAEAYRLYLQGRYFWNKRREKDLLKSLDYFNQAIALDPNYALAYSGLADAYSNLSMGFNFAPRRPEQGFPKAKEAALRALEIDDTLAEAHVSLGMVKERWDWDFAAAEREYKRAIELNPDYATAHHRYSVFLGSMERFDESIAEIERAKQLDPLSLVIVMDSARPYFLTRRFDRAVEILREGLEMDPNFARAHHNLALNYTQMGRNEDAIAEIQKAYELAGGQFREDGTKRINDTLAVIYARAGRRSDALKILAEMDESEQQSRYLYDFTRAVVYAELGDKEQTFKWLEIAYANHSPALVDLKAAVSLDKIRDDARFADLVRRVGLPQ